MSNFLYDLSFIMVAAIAAYLMLNTTLFVAGIALFAIACEWYLVYDNIRINWRICNG